MAEFKAPSNQQNKTAAPVQAPLEASSLGAMEYEDSRASAFQFIQLKAAADENGRRSNLAQLQNKASSFSGISRIKGRFLMGSTSRGPIMRTTGRIRSRRCSSGCRAGGNGTRSFLRRWRRLGMRAGSAGIRVRDSVICGGRWVRMRAGRERRRHSSGSRRGILIWCGVRTGRSRMTGASSTGRGRPRTGRTGGRAVITD